MKTILRSPRLRFLRTPLLIMAPSPPSLLMPSDASPVLFGETHFQMTSSV